MSKIEFSKRVQQLKDSLKVIEASLQRFNGKNKEEIIILATQVRALICKGGPNFHPLLLELSNEINFPLICYGPYGIKEKPIVLDGLTLVHRPQIIDIQPYGRFSRKYELKDWLDSEIIMLSQEIFTPNEILRLKSDSEASHYDPQFKVKLEKLKEVQRQDNSGDISEPDYYILTVAQIILYLGTLLIAEIK